MKGGVKLYTVSMFSAEIMRGQDSDYVTRWQASLCDDTGHSTGFGYAPHFDTRAAALAWIEAEGGRYIR